MSKDRHTIPLHCGECKKTGTANVVDSDPPSSPRRDIEDVSEGFKIQTYTCHGRLRAAIFCECGTVVEA